MSFIFIGLNYKLSDNEKIIYIKSSVKNDFFYIQKKFFIVNIHKTP